MTIKNVLILTAVGFAGAALGFGTERWASNVRAEALTERQAFQTGLDANKDLAAVGIGSCGRIELVEFTKKDGSHETVPVPSPEHAAGLQRRIEALGKAHVHTLINNRNCRGETST